MISIISAIEAQSWEPQRKTEKSTCGRTTIDWISRVSCQKGPICHALAWRVGPFWHDTIDIWSKVTRCEWLKWYAPFMFWSFCINWQPWWRHQMETFSALLDFCAGNSPATGEFTAQRPVTRSFNVFFDLRLNQHLGKQWRRRWFETPSLLVWRHCNDETDIRM